jgi:hypothetical protein
MGPVIVRALVLPLPIHPRQISARRRLDARRLRELRQEVLIALTGVPPHDAAQSRIRLQRRRVDAHSLAIHQARVRKALQHPGEDRLVRLKIDQATRPRDRRVIGRRLRQHQAEKVAQRKRIGSAPGDPALGVDAFEVANQQQSEIDPRGQAGGPSWRRRSRHIALRRRRRSRALATADSTDDRTDDSRPSASSSPSPTSPAVGRVFVLPIDMGEVQYGSLVCRS